MGITECKDCGQETIPGRGSARCASCWNDRNCMETTELEQVKYDLQVLQFKMSMIRCAVEAQARDQGIWADAVHIGEAYLQESLRDLHRVIETSDANAINRIYDRTGTTDDES